MSYEKGRYTKLELSYYELEMINAILSNFKREVGDWFTEENLEDLRKIVSLEISKVNKRWGRMKRVFQCDNCLSELILDTDKRYFDCENKACKEMGFVMIWKKSVEGE